MMDLVNMYLYFFQFLTYSQGSLPFLFLFKRKTVLKYLHHWSKSNGVFYICVLAFHIPTTFTTFQLFNVIY